MININNISSVYFAGIGGIGMSALARYFNEKGTQVSGYDKTATALTDKMIREGINVFFEDDVQLIDKNVGLVIYTPAIPADHKQLQYYRDNNFELLKRSDVLGLITNESFNISIAGTHGKTTTSAMVAHILRESDFGCNAFLGGIATNYETNFWSSANNVSVTEADEYDRSFLKLKPDIAVITAMDADHLDIYGTEENMQDAFIAFSNKIKKAGTLILKNNIERLSEFKADNIITYSASDESAHANIQNISIKNAEYVFDVFINGYSIKAVSLNMGGKHNIENVLAAITVAHLLKIDDEKIKSCVASFKGVKRRFEYIIKSKELVFIDDYAHHPEELRALISGAKELFPNMKCTVLFQPHLFSRTKDLADGFAEVLDMADDVILLPIYPARELPMEGVTSSLISDKMTNKNRRIVDKTQLLESLNISENKLIITAGAGDIDTLVQPIKTLLQS